MAWKSGTRHRSVNGVAVLGSLADIDKVLANLRVQGMTPARLVVTRPHHELGRGAINHVMQRAYAARIPVEQLPDPPFANLDENPEFSVTTKNDCRFWLLERVACRSSVTKKTDGARGRSSSPHFSLASARKNHQTAPENDAQRENSRPFQRRRRPNFQKSPINRPRGRRPVISNAYAHL